jgi:hypothetical protein
MSEPLNEYQGDRIIQLLEAILRELKSIARDVDGIEKKQS